MAQFKVPPEWTDDDRMYYLLAPFQDTNELDSSDSKVVFWRSLINSSSKDIGECVFTVSQLCERLKWKEMEPKCLNNVINIMEKMGEVVKTSKANQGWVGWGVSMVTSPVSWAWKKYVANGSSNDEEYMIISHVKELADRVFSAHLSGVIHVSTDCVYTRAQFEDKCNTVLNNPSEQSVKAVQLELMKQGLLVRSVSSEIQTDVVKLASAKHKPVSSVSETDHGIISIKIMINKLQTLIEKKLTNQAKLKQKCVDLMRHKQKSRAIHFLRISKSFETDVNRLEKHSENLQTILNQIEMADTNAEVLKAFEKGNSALKKVREDHELTLERVESVMEDMQQLIEQGEDINDSFSRDVHDDVINDDELLIELDQLINNDQASIPDQQNVSKTTITAGIDDITRRLGSMTTKHQSDDTGPLPPDHDGSTPHVKVNIKEKKKTKLSSVLLN